MQEAYQKLLDELFDELGAADSEQRVYHCKSTFLGKNGLISRIVKNLAALPPEQRAAAGRDANLLKRKAEIAVENALKRVAALKKQQDL